MKWIWTVVAAGMAFAATDAATSISPVKLAALTAEYHRNPLGIDVARPRLSWQLRAVQRGVVQSAYRIQVAGSEHDLNSGTRLLWDSGKVPSSESIHRVYGGPRLRSGQRYYWHVRVWDGSDRASGWSESAHWEMGLLTPAEWREASWIEPDWVEDVARSQPAPLLRRTFLLRGAVQSARIYATAHGLYELELNGRRVGDQVFAPGWTSFQKRLQYQTYDVTDLVREGANAIGAALGDGWYRGFIDTDSTLTARQRNYYGNRLGLLLQIRIRYRDGRQEIIGTDSQWKAVDGPIRMADFYHGEKYDARLEKKGWSLADYDDREWSNVRVAGYAKDMLIAPAGPPVRRIEEITPVAILTTPAGDTVVDLGQNIVGWVRLRVQGPAGTTVVLRHFEVLDQQGNVYTANLRAAAQTDRYTLKSGGPEVFEPHFTYHAFRYVAIDGYPGALSPDSVTGIVVHSDMPSGGELTTSNPLVNQLQSNIVWSQRGEFLDGPSDAPQRDERLGWTGDAVPTIRTNAYNYNVASFFTRWLKDLAADQLPDGNVPWVIPDVKAGRSPPAAGDASWADAATIIPWTLYLEYGDTRVLEQQYASMRKYVEYVRGRAGDDDLWDGDHQYGDWLALTPTNADLFATEFYAHSVDLIRRAARILGKHDAAARYDVLFERIRAAFQQKFTTAEGDVGANTQTDLVLALQFDLLADEIRPLAARRLAEDVRTRGHLTTGFMSTPYLCNVLSRYGYVDEAYRLLLREEYPSWLYMVRKGATTIWEHWDSIKPDGTFADPRMNAFNHRTLGSVGDWMWSVMAGIDAQPVEPGYKHTLIQPQPGGGLTEVQASHHTPYGTVVSAWEMKNDRFALSVEIPANARASVRLPHARLRTVTEGGAALAGRDGIGRTRQDGESVAIEIGSGTYRFEYPVTDLSPGS